MAVEQGHFPNRIYTDAQGGEHLNGASLFDGAENSLVQQVTFTIVPGGAGSNISNIMFQMADGAGNAIPLGFDFCWWLSDSANAGSLTAVTASGTVGAGTAGTDIFGKVSKKAGDALTDGTGKYQLSITDTAKTPFFVCVSCPGTGVTWVSRRMVTGDYG
jgi:hypothetical protein